MNLRDKMHFIEHIIEPTKLLLTWQSSDEGHRTRYVVAELVRVNEKEVTLAYLTETDDFIKAQKQGFEGYPAFKDVTQIYDNVLDTFMRRLPPRTRSDFPQYLEGLRLKSDVQMSDFALLGYSGAKLLSDGFSIVHPFDKVEGACELLLEVAGYSHIQKNSKILFQIGESVSFSKEFNINVQEDAIRIDIKENLIGYVNRGLIPSFLDWMSQNRITGAWIEKTNGTPEKPTVYLFVKVDASY